MRVKTEIRNRASSFLVGRNRNRVRVSVLVGRMLSIRFRGVVFTTGQLKNHGGLGPYLVVLLFNLVNVQKVDLLRVFGHMAIHSVILITTNSSLTILSRSNLVAMLLRDVRKVDSGGSHFD